MEIRLLPVSLNLAILFFITSCEHIDTYFTTSTESIESSVVEQDTPPQNEWAAPTQSTEVTESKGLAMNQDVSERQPRQQIIELGNGQFIADPNQPVQSSTQNSDGDITLNFQETDIREFIKVILSDVLSENYLIDPKVNGTVTIETPNPLNKQDLFPLLENILSINNAAITKVDGIYRILPKQDIVSGNLSPSTKNSAAKAGYGVRIIPLQFISAQEMQIILEPFVADKASIRVDKQRNLLMISGTPQEINNIQETIDVFDVDWLRGMSVGLYPLDYVDPKSLTAELDSVLKGVQGSDQELLGGLIRIVPIERLNSILLISPTTSALREAELWLYRLDRPGDHVGQRLYVYNVQNAKAIELADILNNIFSSDQTTAIRREAELAPGLTPVEVTQQAALQTTENPSLPITPPSKSDSGLSITTNSQIEIIADDVRNALVILASSQDYQMIEAAISKLDIVPLQVLIEASIIEVTLNDDLRYGVEWFFKNGIGEKSGNGVLDVADAGIGAIAPGFSYTIIDSAAGVRFALNAIESKTTIDVVSSPSLMVLDNKEANINVGDQIPIPTRQSVSNIDPNSPTVNEIEFRDTGISLTVKPRVNESGLVTMEVSQEVSDAQTTTTSGLDAPTIRQREIQSTVAVYSGETIVLGGLIRDSQNFGNDGIPFLHTIPIIGKLFGRTSHENRRTELLVLITPTVVRDRKEARDITDEFRRKLKGLRPVKNEAGS